MCFALNYCRIIHCLTVYRGILKHHDKRCLYEEDRTLKGDASLKISFSFVFLKEELNDFIILPQDKHVMNKKT